MRHQDFCRQSFIVDRMVVMIQLTVKLSTGNQVSSEQWFVSCGGTLHNSTCSRYYLSISDNWFSGSITAMISLSFIEQHALQVWNWIIVFPVWKVLSEETESGSVTSILASASCSWVESSLATLSLSSLHCNFILISQLLIILLHCILPQHSIWVRFVLRSQNCVNWKRKWFYTFTNELFDDNFGLE